MSFRMTGFVQFAGTLASGNAALSDSVSLPTNLADGTASGQANGYWSDIVTLPASDDHTIDLLSLAVSAFGLSGTTGFASVKHLLLQNTSDQVALTVQPGDVDGWDQIGVTAVGKSGIMVLHSPVAGLAVGGSAKTVKITNEGTVTTLTGDTTTGSGANTITGLSSTSGLTVGMTITGTGIPAGAKIASITNGTSLVMTADATAIGTGVSLDFAWPDAEVRIYIAGILD
jgi:hypothetical protein